MSDDLRERLDARLAAIEADMSKSDPRFVSKEVREIVELSRSALALLDRGGGPVAWVLYGERDLVRRVVFNRAELDAEMNRPRVYRPRHVVELFARPAPAETSEGERRYTLDEIDAALYDAHREWDGENMRSLSDLMVERLLTPTGDETP